MIRKLANGFLYAGQGKKGYIRIREVFLRDNRKTLILMSSLVAIVTMGFAIAAMIIPALESGRAGYAIVSLSMFTIAVLSASIKTQNQSLIQALTYVFTAIVYGLGVYTGTIASPNELSISFVLMISLLPLIFSDRPINKTILVLIAVAAYIGIGYRVKPMEILYTDILDIVAFGTTGLMLNVMLTKMRADTFTLSFQNIMIKDSLFHKQKEMDAIHMTLHSSDWSIEYDEAGEIIETNFANVVAMVSGKEVAETEHFHIQNWVDSVHPDDLDRVWGEAKRVLQDREGTSSYDVEYRFHIIGQGYKWVRTIGRVSRRADGSPIMFFGLFMNVDNQKKVELKTARNLAIVEVLSKDYTDVFLIDWQKEISTAIKVRGQMVENPSVHAYPYKETWEKYCSNYVHPNDAERVLKAFEKEHVIQKLQENDEFTCTYRVTYQGEVHHHQAKYFQMKGNDLEETLIVAGYRNIDDIVAAEEEQRKSLQDALDAVQESSETLQAVEIDELTGLYTRQAFLLHADHLRESNEDKAFDLLLTDIEDFKQINENYGNQIGDEILQSMAKYLATFRRDNVIVGRYSGDRFAVLFEHSDEDSIERVQAMIDGLVFDESLPNAVVKYGLIQNVGSESQITTLCDRALISLNSIKHQYGVNLAMYDDVIKQKVETQRNIENSMRQALKDEQFRVYYQPKHDAVTGKLMGAEALIRWIHPAYGFMSPGDFIPIFEKNGFISEVDYYVWQRTCENIKRWGAKGKEVVPISINLSRLDLLKKDYVEQLIHYSKKNEIPSRYLHVEVTESVMMDDVDYLISKLKDFRSEGFKIELDDFGAGYSTLNILSSLPLDVVKLDMSFMRQFGDEKRLKVLEASINLAKNLGLKTVSEGVETEEQLQGLRQMGVDAIQGYYYSKPLSEEDFEKYLLDYELD